MMPGGLVGGLGPNIERVLGLPNAKRYYPLSENVRKWMSKIEVGFVTAHAVAVVVASAHYCGAGNELHYTYVSLAEYGG